MIDLHIHTNASDGAHSPEEIVQLVKQKGLYCFAIADHNSIGSLKRAWELAEEEGLNFLPAVEFDTFYKELDLHLLAYGIDFTNPSCSQWMEEIFEAKLRQTKKRVEKLKALGFKIDFDTLMKIAGNKQPTGGDYVRALSQDPEGRNDPRVRAYIDGERSNSPYLNFYLDWLKAGRPAFVPFEEMEITKVIKRAKALGAVLVLAHPSDTPEEYVEELAQEGLDGLEVYTSYHSSELAEKWLKIAQRLGLIPTAGSDFHGKKVKPDVELGIECAFEKEMVEKLVQRISQRRGKFIFKAG